MYRVIKKISAERGVVMMETILTLPIYLIMLAGLFWLGELCLARMAFSQGENLRLWENGLRHPFSPVAERDLFYFLPELNSGDEVVTGSGLFRFSRTSPAQSGGWGVGISGEASAETNRSDWSFGLNNGALAVLGQAGSSLRRLRITDSTVKHLLNRNDYYGRNMIYTAGRDSGTLWKNEYEAVWTVGTETIRMPSGGQARAVRLYNSGTRNIYYNSWSL